MVKFQDKQIIFSALHARVFIKVICDKLLQLLLTLSSCSNNLRNHLLTVLSIVSLTVNLTTLPAFLLKTICLMRVPTEIGKYFYFTAPPTGFSLLHILNYRKF